MDDVLTGERRVALRQGQRLQLGNRHIGPGEDVDAQLWVADRRVGEPGHVDIEQGARFAERDGEEALLVRAEGRIHTQDDIRAIVVASHPTGVVRVSDVADVRWGALARNGVVTRNGEGEAVWGIVLGLRGANARTVVEGAKARLAELQRTIAELETGGLPLERTLELHERGAALLERCETLLRTAELRMRQLVSKGGTVETIAVTEDRTVDEA